MHVDMDTLSSSSSTSLPSPVDTFPDTRTKCASAPIHEGTDEETVVVDHATFSTENTMRLGREYLPKWSATRVEVQARVTVAPKSAEWVVDDRLVVNVDGQPWHRQELKSQVPRP